MNTDGPLFIIGVMVAGNIALMFLGALIRESALLQILVVTIPITIIAACVINHGFRPSNDPKPGSTPTDLLGDDDYGSDE